MGGCGLLKVTRQPPGHVAILANPHLLCGSHNDLKCARGIHFSVRHGAGGGCRSRAAAFQRAGVQVLAPGGWWNSRPSVG